MNDPQVEDGFVHRVVVNQEGQYALWFADQEIPAGWEDAGKVGAREECLAFVEEVWTDMTPASLRKTDGACG